MQNPILFSKKSDRKKPHVKEGYRMCVPRECCKIELQAKLLLSNQNNHRYFRTQHTILARVGMARACKRTTRPDTTPMRWNEQTRFEKKKKIRAHPLPDKNSAEYRGTYSQRLESIYPRLQWWVHDTDPRPSKG